MAPRGSAPQPLGQIKLKSGTKRPIKLPSLHANQEKVFTSVARDGVQFTVIAAGRRFGKTFTCLALALEYAINRGKKVWWVSPSYSVSDNQWRLVKRIIGSNFSGKSEQGRRIEFYYEWADGTKQFGELTFKTGDNPDLLRGEGLDLLIIDEAAFVDPRLWETLRPALVDQKGSAVMISTPYGLNWFYKMYQRGQSDETGKWRSWHFTSYDNPLLDPAEIDSAREDMPEDRFQQEHMAVFADDQSSIFRGLDKAAVVQKQSKRIPSHMYVMGVDWGRKHDATVISVIDINTGEQVWMDRFTQTSWSLQKSRLQNAVARWQPKKIYIEENAAGQPVIESLQQELGMKNIEPVYTSSANKGVMIESLSLAIERGELKLLDEDTRDAKEQLLELRMYQLKRVGNSWVYSAPKGFHDDTVMALALAWLGATGKAKGIIQGANPFYGSRDPQQQRHGSQPANPFRSQFSRYQDKRREEVRLLVEQEQYRYQTQTQTQTPSQMQAGSQVGSGFHYDQLDGGSNYGRNVRDDRDDRDDRDNGNLISHDKRNKGRG